MKAFGTGVREGASESMRECVSRVNTRASESESGKERCALGMKPKKEQVESFLVCLDVR